jgi:DNA helicase-2/ATP-dependent DNA helicase PcrA
MQNVNELINSIIIFEEKTSGATITDFFNEISLYTDQKDTDNNANDSVTVMTIHMAKGMEFNNVFVIGLNENVFPSRNSLNSNALEEERRVAYVALTRSKLRLFISNAGGYSVINNEQLSPSRFIGDIHHTNYTQKSLSMRSISKVDLDWFDSNKKDVDYKKEMYEEKTVEINVGDSVSHTVFGLGLVIRMNGDQIDVLFKSPYGLKTILKNHKNVNRINR